MSAKFNLNLFFLDLFNWENIVTLTKSDFRAFLKLRLLTGNDLTDFHHDLNNIIRLRLPSDCLMRLDFVKHMQIFILNCATKFEINEQDFQNSNQDFINGLTRLIGKQWLPEVHDQMRTLLLALSFKARGQEQRNRRKEIDWNVELNEYLQDLRDILIKLRVSQLRGH